MKLIVLVKVPTAGCGLTTRLTRFQIMSLAINAFLRDSRFLKTRKAYPIWGRTRKEQRLSSRPNRMTRRTSSAALAQDSLGQISFFLFQSLLSSLPNLVTLQSAISVADSFLQQDKRTGWRPRVLFSAVNSPRTCSQAFLCCKLSLALQCIGTSLLFSIVGILLSVFIRIELCCSGARSPDLSVP